MKKYYNIHQLLDMMSASIKVNLSETGKRKFDEIDTGVIKPSLADQTWDILAINCDNTIKVCAENHFIHSAAPIDWFIVERGNHESQKTETQKEK